MGTDGGGWQEMILSKAGHNDDSNGGYGPSTSIASSKSSNEMTENILLKSKKIHEYRNRGKGPSKRHEF